MNANSLVSVSSFVSLVAVPNQVYQLANVVSGLRGFIAVSVYVLQMEDFLKGRQTMLHSVRAELHLFLCSCKTLLNSGCFMGAMTQMQKYMARTFFVDIFI